MDATTRGFLGLTVACAQCHDHKFDPIPHQGLLFAAGVFNSTEAARDPLAPRTWSKRGTRRRRRSTSRRRDSRNSSTTQTRAARRDPGRPDRAITCSPRGKLRARRDLDRETLERWTKYLADPQKGPPLPRSAGSSSSPKAAPAATFEAAARDFQTLVDDVNEEKNQVDEKNKIKLGLESRPQRHEPGATSSPCRIEKYNLWRDLFASPQQDAGGALQDSDGVYYYGSGKIDRFLSGEWKRQLDSLRAELADSKKALPPQYPFLQTIKDTQKPAGHARRDSRRRQQPRRRGAARFLSILCDGEPQAVHEGQRPAGTGRGDRGPGESAHRARDGEPHLAASFGRGIVDTPSNFGQHGRAADASGAAGLPGRAVRGERVVDQGDASRDHALRRCTR